VSAFKLLQGGAICRHIKLLQGGAICRHIKLLQGGSICRHIELLQGGAICRHVKLLQGGVICRHVKLLCIDCIELNLKSKENSGLREGAVKNYSHFEFVLRGKLTLKMEALRSSTPSLTTSAQTATYHNLRIFDNLILETACAWTDRFRQSRGLRVEGSTRVYVMGA